MIPREVTELVEQIAALDPEMGAEFRDLVAATNEAQNVIDAATVVAQCATRLEHPSAEGCYLVAGSAVEALKSALVLFGLEVSS